MSGELILIIDDSREIVRHLTEYLLPTLGYEGVAAFDGHEGLKRLRERRPDLILLDLNLPEMTGLDVLQIMARDSVDVPVVLMTGYGSEKAAIEAFRLGIKDYLVKPFTADEVQETIERGLLETRLRHDRQRLVEKVRRMEGEMRRQIREMRTLFGIGKMIVSLLSQEKVMEHVIQGSIDLTGAERGTIWLPNEDGTMLLPYSRGVLEQKVHFPSLPVEGSSVGEVFRTGEVQRDAVFSSRGIKIQTDVLARAILYVPLTLRGEIIAVLGVSNHKAPRAFSERDELLLSALADYAAIALENARTYEATDQALAARMEELRTLLRITRTITSSLDLEEVGKLTIREVHASWDIEAASIWLRQGGRDTLRVLANVGSASEVLSQCTVEVGRGIVGHVVATGEPMYTNNAASHPYHYREIDTLTGFETNSILCVPLEFNNEVIGALQLLNRQDGVFGAEDIERASSIATAVAIAVSNARLFAESSERRRLLAATLEHNGNPVLITDVEGRLILLNQQARERLALTGKAIGRPAAEVIAQPELAMMLSHPPHHEVGVQRREVELGEDTFYLCTLAPIPGYGQILVLQDVSYLKELDTVKSNFVATVSHDLRAPLNSIMGFASTLSQVGPLTKEQVKFVQRINASAQRMSNLVTSLLDLARVDSRLEQSRELCDVVALAKSVLTDLQGRALTKEIALVLDVEGSPAPVVGDPAQIRQAITNLVDNAIKYSPAGHAVRVALETQSDTLLVKVYDQGPGISSRDISHIFDRFYRGKDKKYQLEHGSGLGLTLVRSIAEAHGGWVWVESEPEKGSTFTLQLPLVREEERAHTVGADG